MRSIILAFIVSLISVALVYGALLWIAEELPPAPMERPR